MFEVWRKNILANLELVKKNDGPGLVTVVSGSESDKSYWEQHLASTSRDVFRETEGVSLVSVCEKIPKGNFLGTLNAWAETKKALALGRNQPPGVFLMSMVFGKGKRLSPFTQALGNRKSAFLMPVKASRAATYLRTADLSNLYSNQWVHYLSTRGFRGAVVKWADEAIIPGIQWELENRDFSDIDAVRFVWRTDVTETLAREKEWIVIDEQSGLTRFEQTRQDISNLRMRMSEFEGRGYEVAVNLGSVAISYDFLDAALEVLSNDIGDETKSVDWDPYAWTALYCEDEAQWRAEVEHDARMGKTPIKDLETKYPDFYQRIAQLRKVMESKKGRPLKVGFLDFGQPFWIDVGLHITLRRSLESLTLDTEPGAATRDLFRVPHERDNNGNTIVRSVVPPSADIRNSVIVDSVILDEDSVVHGGVVIGGRHRHLHMPHGGSALFCAADRLIFTGQHGIAFLAMGSEVTIHEGGRHTTLLLPDFPRSMISNETILDYSGEIYTKPILGNPLSFESAGERMSELDGQELEARWLDIWRHWLK